MHTSSKLFTALAAGTMAFLSTALAYGDDGTERSEPSVSVVVINQGRDDYDDRVPLDRKGRPARVLEALPGEAPPDGYERVMRPNRGLIGAGAGVLGGGYLVSLMTQLWGGMLHGYGDDTWAYGFIPLVGPIISAADPGTDSTVRGFLVVSAIMQNVGLGLTIAGASLRTPIWKRSAEVELKVSPGFVGVQGSF